MLSFCKYSNFEGGEIVTKKHKHDFLVFNCDGLGVPGVCSNEMKKATSEYYQQLRQKNWFAGQFLTSLATRLNEKKLKEKNFGFLKSKFLFAVVI